MTGPPAASLTSMMLSILTRADNERERDEAGFYMQETDTVYLNTRFRHEQVTALAAPTQDTLRPSEPAACRIMTAGQPVWHEGQTEESDLETQHWDRIASLFGDNPDDLPRLLVIDDILSGIRTDGPCNGPSDDGIRALFRSLRRGAARLDLTILLIVPQQGTWSSARHSMWIQQPDTVLRVRIHPRKRGQLVLDAPRAGEQGINGGTIFRPQYVSSGWGRPASWYPMRALEVKEYGELFARKHSHNQYRGD